MSEISKVRTEQPADPGAVAAIEREALMLCEDTGADWSSAVAQVYQEIGEAALQAKNGAGLQAPAKMAEILPFCRPD